MLGLFFQDIRRRPVNLNIGQVNGKEGENVQGNYPRCWKHNFHKNISLVAYFD